MFRTASYSGILVLLLLAGYCRAGQFMGGELSYRFISRSGNDFTYELTFRLYRNCFSDAQLNSPVIRILNTTNISQSTQQIIYREETLTDPVITSLSYATPPFCVINKPQDCITIMEYKRMVTLSYSVEGYTIFFTDCCRDGRTNLQVDASNWGNEMINGLIPESGQGLTFYAIIPPHDKVEKNSSPVPHSDSIIYACKGRPVSTQFRFTDADGDLLKYRFAASMAKTGAATTNFSALNFNSGYQLSAPAGNNMLLDSLTGVFSGTPTAPGKYALVIAVEEYRNGSLVNIHRKEYQMNVSDCEIRKPTDIIDCSDSSVLFSHTNHSSNQYAWDFGVPEITSDVSVQSHPFYTYPRTGTFDVKLTITSPDGCTDSAFSVVRIYPGLRAHFSWTGMQCEGQELHFKDSSVTVYGQVVLWSWTILNTNNHISSDPVFTHTPQVWGTMPFPLAVQLEVTTDIGCTHSVIRDVLIYPKVDVQAGPDRILAFNQPYTMPATVAGGQSYEWIPATGLDLPNTVNPVLTSAQDAVYVLKASNPGGCADSDSVRIRYMKGPAVYVPTAFTPNGDGRNDVLRFFPVSIQLKSFTIFTRWGEKIFSSSDYDRGWDGTLRGIPQPSGTYLWVVEGTDLSGARVVEKGNILLMR